MVLAELASFHELGSRHGEHGIHRCHARLREEGADVSGGPASGGLHPMQMKTGEDHANHRAGRDGVARGGSFAAS